MLNRKLLILTKQLNKQVQTKCFTLVCLLKSIKFLITSGGSRMLLGVVGYYSWVGFGLQCQTPVLSEVYLTWVGTELLSRGIYSLNLPRRGAKACTFGENQGRNLYLIDFSYFTHENLVF